MPQTMRIQTPPPRRKIQKFQTHRHNNPRHRQPGPRRPRPLRLPVFLETKPTPHHVLDDSHYYIRSHVVRVVPVPPFEIRYMPGVHSDAENGPKSQYGFRFLAAFIETEYSDHGVI